MSLYTDWRDAKNAMETTETQIEGLYQSLIGLRNTELEARKALVTDPAIIAIWDGKPAGLYTRVVGDNKYSIMWNGTKITDLEEIVEEL
jgi:hypothetical protein